jgi:hypothetical protein
MYKLFVMSLLVVGLWAKPVDDEAFRGLKKEVVKRLEGSWCSAEKAEKMMDLVRETRPKVCVEIGAYAGWTVLPVAATLKYLKEGRVYAIDAWSNHEAVKSIPAHNINYQWWSRLDMRFIKRQFESLLTEWNLWAYCWIIHDTSEEAVGQIPEIDFLHLDGNCSEEGSLLDTELYLPKVKSGGYILLSNLFFSLDGKHPKMATLWRLMDECEVVWEIEGSNVVLFRKN